MKICKSDSVSGQAVDIRRFDLASKDPDVTETQVIREDYQDIRSFTRRVWQRLWRLWTSLLVAGEQYRERQDIDADIYSLLDCLTKHFEPPTAIPNGSQTDINVAELGRGQILRLVPLGPRLLTTGKIPDAA